MRRPAGADALDARDERVACCSASGVETLERFDVPVAQHDRHEDLLVVHREVVDAGARDRLARVRSKSTMPVPGISNVRTCRSIAHTIAEGSISSAAVARSR